MDSIQEIKTHAPVTNAFVSLVTKHPRAVKNAVCYMLCLALPFWTGQLQLDAGTIPLLMKSDFCVLLESRFHHTVGGSSQNFRQTSGHHIGPSSLLLLCPAGITEKWLSWNRHRCLKKRGWWKKHYTKPLHVSNEYTPQLLALFYIFYIFTYTKYFQTSMRLFKTPSVTCLAEQIPVQICSLGDTSLHWF